MARAKTDRERIQEALDDIVRFALALPEVEESTSYGQPALKRGGRLIFALRKDLETLALVCGFEERAILMKDHPETFFITDHYLNYPAVVVRLLGAKKTQLRSTVKAAWERIGVLGPAKAKAKPARARPSRRRN